MWYPINEIGCRTCGFGCAPLAWQCSACQNHPFINAAYVAGPIPFTRFLSLIILRLLVAIPVLAYLGHKELFSGDRAPWKMAVFTVLLVGIGILFLIQLIQLWHLSRLRVVIESSGLNIYQQKSRGTRMVTFGWHEVLIPAKSSRLRWFKWLGCLLGPTHIIGLIIPEALDEIIIHSLYSTEKRVVFGLTDSFCSTHWLIGWISAFALPIWLQREWIKPDSEHPPSKEIAHLYLNLQNQELGAYVESENEENSAEETYQETPGESALRRLDLAPEAETGFGVPYGNQRLFVHW